MNEKDFKRLLTLYLDGELTTEEIIQLKKAVEETPAYRHQFQDEIKLHTLMREVVSEKIEEKKLSNKASRKKSVKKVSKQKPILAYAFAAVAVLAVTGVIFGFYYTQNLPKYVALCVETPSEGEHIVMRDGEQLTLHKDMELFERDKIVSSDSGGAMLILKDGTMISLEQDTSLALFENDQAQISLIAGQVLLEVSKRTKDKSPFRIKTRDSVMTVLGTIFSVKAEEGGFTKLSVYEGKVELERMSDSKKVQLVENQSVITSDDSLSKSQINQDVVEEKEPDVLSLLPEDDIYVENGKVNNSKLLKIRKDERTIFMKFKLEGVGRVKKAVIKMTQDIDPGSGTMFFHLADHNDWSERDKRSNRLPKPAKLMARRTGPVTIGKTISVDLSDSINKDGIYTIIITLNKGEGYDIWFSSKEGAKPPILEISR